MNWICPRSYLDLIVDLDFVDMNDVGSITMFWYFHLMWCKSVYHGYFIIHLEINTQWVHLEVNCSQICSLKLLGLYVGLCVQPHEIFGTLSIHFYKIWQIVTVSKLHF